MVLTVPMCAVFAHWLQPTWESYRTFGLRHGDGGGSASMLAPTLRLEWKQWQRKLRLGLVGKQASGQEGVIRVDLALQEAAEAQLNSRLPGSGRSYVSAMLAHADGKIENSDVRYRGDFFWHWAMEKKSWRIKTKKKSLWNGIRKFNLIVPKSMAIIDGHLSYWLAKEMDLLAPRSGVAEFWINGENRGLHTLVEQPEELFLRANHRMPTDLYVGELVAEDAFAGVGAKLFDAPEAWGKSSINNHEAPLSVAPLQVLCALLDLAPDGDKAMARLRSIMDVDAFARFAAYRVITQSGHHDDMHNWRMYYDPWKRGFEPVVWDPNAWHRLWGPLDHRPFFQIPLFSEFDRVVARDHVFRWALHQELARAFASGLDQRLIDEAQSERDKMWSAAQRDPALGAYFLYMDMDQVQKDSDALEAMVGGYLGQARRAQLEAPMQVAVRRMADGPLGDGPGLAVRVQVDGWRPIARLELRGDGSFSPVGRWYLVGEGDAAGRFVDCTDRVQKVGNAWILDRPLLPGLHQADGPKGDPLFPALPEARALTYRIEYHGPEWQGPLELWAHPLQGLAVQIPREESLEPASMQGELGVFAGWDNPSAQDWSGQRTIEGFQVVPGDLRLAPGTELRMGPGATLVVRGKLTALGTEEQPILVLPAQEEQAPWGALVLRSQGASGSQLEHVHMRGGSGYRDVMQEYSGMLSLHDVDRVRFGHCRFEDSQVVDDMVHAVYARELEFVDCLFQNSKLDALDLDGCEAVLSRCEFRSSGNDAVDLMMSRAVIQDCLLMHSGDKGVSVGEDSVLLLLDSRLLGNSHGVQSKDSSVVWARRCEFESKGPDVAAFTKNWRYGGPGSGLFEDCSFSGREVVQAAKGAKLWFFGCAGTESWRESKQILIEEGPGSGPGGIAPGWVLDGAGARPKDWPSLARYEGQMPFVPFLK